jgi:hypothetical protein
LIILDFSGRFIELGREKNGPKGRLEKIIEWMQSRRDIDKFVFGQIVDAWYGPFDEMDEL